jgi:GrpB-like predicted nucleotidyltransferase (UPF0157 family)
MSVWVRWYNELGSGGRQAPKARLAGSQGEADGLAQQVNATPSLGNQIGGFEPGLRASASLQRPSILNAMSDGAQPDFLQQPVRADGPVRLADPDPEWGAQYARQEERIRAALGPRAVRIEHVGSTSVPGLAAKPVIDIVLVVADSANEDDYVPDLETAGYTLQFREPDWYEHRFLRDHDPEVQIHVFTLGSPEVERMLIFRDRLRSRSEERELYQRTKRELASRRWDYIQDYADAKSSVVEEIIARAHADQQT